MLPIAEMIRTLRREKDMTQEELAQALGVSFQAVSRWENSQTYPDIELLPKLAAVLGTTTDSLLGADKEAREKEAWNLYTICSAASYSEKAPLKLHEFRMEIFRKMPPDHQLTLQLANEICRTLIYENVLPRAEALPFVRELGGYLLNQTVQQTFHMSGLRYLYIFEEEERIKDLWKYAVDPRIWRSLEEERYLVLHEYDRHNLQMQKNLYAALTETLPAHAVMLYDDPIRTAHAGIRAAEFTLQLMDAVRNGDDSTDLFLSHRADTYLTMADYCFLAGEYEKGYEALEEALRMCRILVTSPPDLKRTCSHPLFNLLSVTGTTDIHGHPFEKHQESVYLAFWRAFRGLETQTEHLHPYQQEERYRDILARLDSFDPTPGAIRDPEELSEIFTRYKPLEEYRQQK